MALNRVSSYNTNLAFLALGCGLGFYVGGNYHNWLPSSMKPAFAYPVQEFHKRKAYTPPHPDKQNANFPPVIYDSGVMLGTPKVNTDWARKDTKYDSLAVRHLTPSLWKSLSKKKTANGIEPLVCTLTSGVELRGSRVGIYAGDAESYTAFEQVFEPVIADIHSVHRKVDSSTVQKFDVDPNHLKSPKENWLKHVESVRIRVVRNLDAPFTTTQSRCERRETEEILKSVFSSLPASLSGEYTSLADMSGDEQLYLAHKHLLYNLRDDFLLSAGAEDHWPAGRGVFRVKTEGTEDGGKGDVLNLSAFVGHEDHLRMACLGKDLRKVFKKLFEFSTAMETALKDKGRTFAKSSHLGYLSTCPSNLGTTLRVSGLVHLPKLSRRPDFRNVINELGLELRGTDQSHLLVCTPSDTLLRCASRLPNKGTHGEHTFGKLGIYDVSNVQRLGMTEVEIVNSFIDAVDKLITKEREEPLISTVDIVGIGSS